MSLSRCAPRSRSRTPSGRRAAHQVARSPRRSPPARRGRPRRSGPPGARPSPRSRRRAPSASRCGRPSAPGPAPRPATGRPPARAAPAPPRRPRASAVREHHEEAVALGAHLGAAHAPTRLPAARAAGRPAPRHRRRPAASAAASTPRCRRTASSPSRTAGHSCRPPFQCLVPVGDRFRGIIGGTSVSGTIRVVASRAYGLATLTGRADA